MNFTEEPKKQKSRALGVAEWRAVPRGDSAGLIIRRGHQYGVLIGYRTLVRAQGKSAQRFDLL